MSIITSPMLLGADTGGAYQITRSLRFNAPDSAYLSRTPSVAGNRKTWTWAGWVKRSKLGTNQALIHCRISANTDDTSIAFTTSDTLRVVTGASDAVNTNAVFRDTSAWYHITCAFDTTQATAANRIKLYVNGVEQTFASTSYPSQNSDWSINSASAHNIGAYNIGVFYGDFYLDECCLIDGQALTPSSFAETNATTGQWVPKAFSGGSYGTNGFKLTFSDNSTAAALGTDTSGNGNTWTVNNFSVTAGAGNDSLVDTPVSSGTDAGNGGEVRGNYCTWNPLTNSAAQLNYSNGNLDIAQSNAASYALPIGTIGVSSGKWYWETTITSAGSCRTGVLKDGSSLSTYLGSASTAYAYASGGYKASNNSNTTSGYSTYTNGDVIGIALDLDNGKIYFSKNGTWQESGNPATQTNPAYTGLLGTYFASWGKDDYVTTSCSINAGARPFAYTAPSGFKALCDTNLPAPLVAKPSTVMDVKLYTGNGSTQTISGLGFSPDLVWIKNRTLAVNHYLWDTVRGNTKSLKSNATDAEQTLTDLPSFNNDGFSVNNDNGILNTSSSAYVAWAFDAGSSTVSNTQGSITSSVRANASAGFSIVTYTGNLSSSGTATVGHGLNVAPQMIITKRRNGASDWVVQHAGLPSANNLIYLNSTSSTGTSAYGTIVAPTSSVFTTAWITGLNTNGDTHVGYCFAPVSGYNSISSYVGNGSSDGVFVYTGHRTRWLMIKRTDAADSWQIMDAARSDYNVADDQLYADLSNAESSTSTRAIDFLSNGFKVRGNNAGINASGGTYVYVSFAESPFQYSRAR